MDSFEVIITPQAREMLERYVDYIQYTLLNEQAAESVWQDAVKTIGALQLTALAHRISTHPVLKKLDYRLAFFQKHSYVILYRVEERMVYVEAIYHTLQDYENWFAIEAEDDDV